MQTRIHKTLQGRPEIEKADSILRRCVHCGFCTATCPTYQLLGDELDGPRGRIYLIKNLLEENDISEASAIHLDRCLTCRACETTCPSGVEYGRLLDIGRELVAEKRQVSGWRKLKSAAIRFVVPKRGMFRVLFMIGHLVRPILPGFLKQHLPGVIRRRAGASVAVGNYLLLSGCVQSTATPGVVNSLSQLLSETGERPEIINEGCCGALDLHLSAHDAARERMKRVIDLVYPRLDAIDGIVSSATGCAATIVDYPEVLAGDAIYSKRAQALVAKLIDPVELLERMTLPKLSGRVAVQTPCSMQHGLKINGRIENLLERCGIEVVPHKDGHLCCGSAGAYSILEPGISQQLKERKLEALTQGKPDVILTANVGCQLHLGSDTGTPVMHWLEYLDDRISQ